MVTISCRKSSLVQSSPTESRSSDRKLKPLPPDPFRHQDSAIALLQSPVSPVPLGTENWSGENRPAREHRPRQHEAFDCHAFKRNRQEECVQMPVKLARSAPRPSFGLPELLVAIQPRVSLAARP